MHVSLEIGQNRHFELREALLIYHSTDRHYWEMGNTFVTHHPVATKGTKKPELGPANPLTVDFLQSLLHSLGGQIPIEFLPDNVMARTDRTIAWWTPAQIRPMFFGDTQGDLQGINGRNFPQPALIWLTQDSSLFVRALKENRRPSAASGLSVAPYWNLYESGSVCIGSMRAPKVSTVASIGQWEKSFYESEFTHGNVGRVTRHAGGFEGLWKELADKDAFPVEQLIELPETAEEFLQQKRRSNDY
ncbi:PRTRC system protein B [Acidicapsa dinghuensis]|uniref:PRTRC system protein B n=1 Tax=Acidicapsa dinghuensis TaxID=2218256 RepID=A0ABW1EDJ2_9BACT